MSLSVLCPTLTVDRTYKIVHRKTAHSRKRKEEKKKEKERGNSSCLITKLKQC
jgi:hypothetical protein